LLGLRYQISDRDTDNDFRQRVVINPLPRLDWARAILPFDTNEPKRNSGFSTQKPYLLVRLRGLGLRPIRRGSIWAASAEIMPGQTIAKQEADKVAELVSPGNYALVRQGMVMNIVPTRDYDWPPPFRSSTEHIHRRFVLVPRASCLTTRRACRFR
jgi:hypothetical protein